MDIQTRKLRLIEAFLKIKDNSILDKMEELLRSKPMTNPKPEVDKFVGIWSKDEAEEIKKVIAEGCEQINEEDW
ncbi:hypothetical protein [Fulvivirga imtechensis]|nr:hypothetical protein [Fulvivirga imtechensis]